MKIRKRKIYHLGSSYYNIECLMDGHCFSVCSTNSDDKELADRLKKCVSKCIEDGIPLWFTKEN